MKILEEQLPQKKRLKGTWWAILKLKKTQKTYVTQYITPLVGLFLKDFRASFDFPSLQTDTLVRTTSCGCAGIHCRVQMRHSTHLWERSLNLCPPERGLLLNLCPLCSVCGAVSSFWSFFPSQGTPSPELNHPHAAVKLQEKRSLRELSFVMWDPED